MSFDWDPLRRELDAFAEAGATLPVWHRDDDAVAPTPELETLVAMNPCVVLAVIPAGATQALAERVARAPDVRVSPHGWSHANHEPPERRKAEFGSARPVEARLAEARRGRERIADLFGAQSLAMFTPPWNRLSNDLPPRLTEAGFSALSTDGPRGGPYAAAGLRQVNTHLDPIDWRAGGGLREPGVLIERAASLLAERRLGRADAEEPFGLLTHHLVHDAAIWRFCEGWFEVLSEHSAVVRPAGPFSLA